MPRPEKSQHSIAAGEFSISGLAVTLHYAEKPFPDLLALRHEVLRPGKPFESCHFNGDETEGGRHFALYQADQVVAIISLLKAFFPLDAGKKAYQLRGMATQRAFRGNGLAKFLLNEGLRYAQHQGANLVWCNARANVAGLYSKQGFEIHGDQFCIEDLGSHYLMSRALSPADG